MPIYIYDCPDCKRRVDQMRLIADRDEPGICSYCGGLLARCVAVPIGLLTGMYNDPRESLEESPAVAKVPNITLSNTTVYSKGGGFQFGRGSHIKVQNMRATTARPLFELYEGATIDAANVVHHAENDHGKAIKRGLQRRRKRR